MVKGQLSIIQKSHNIDELLQDESRSPYEKLKRYKQYLENRQSVVKLIEQGRQQLKRLYQEEQNEDKKRLRKRRILAQLKQGYQQLTSRFEVPDGFKYWFTGDLNNAKLALVSTYHSRVCAFRNQLQSQNGDYPEFYQQVKKIAGLVRTERHNNCLDFWIKLKHKPESCI